MRFKRYSHTLFARVRQGGTEEVQQTISHAAA